MIKVTIRNLEGVQTHGAEMEDPSAWIVEQVAANSWGEAEAWIKVGDLTPAQADRQSDDTREDDDGYTEVRVPASYTIETTDTGNETVLAALRFERNARLGACDWTQLADAPLSGPEKAAWVAYRQALRDLPESAENPSNPTWPEQP